MKANVNMHRIIKGLPNVYLLGMLFFFLNQCLPTESEKFKKTRDLTKDEIIQLPDDLFGVYYLVNQEDKFNSIDNSIGIRIDPQKHFIKISISLGVDYFFYSECRIVKKHKQILIICKDSKKFQFQMTNRELLRYDFGPNIFTPVDPNDPLKSRQSEQIFKNKSLFIRSRKDTGSLSDFNITHITSLMQQGSN